MGACFFFMIAAAFPSVLEEDFRPLQPVLRSNFWLTIHVLTIVASYGAGLLAWLIGLVGLSFYLFGRYRDPVVATNLPKGLRPAGGDYTPAALGKLPPEACAALAGYAYRAVQVAVLLLAAGTILGGLWADVSWGRFWGWDPKEVWALVSLLVYLAILHGRFAGWFNNFGMIVGTVLGMMAIAFSWYGVNFALPLVSPDGQAGLHSYGSGTGGIEVVAAFVALNVCYLIAAWIRYAVMTGSAVAPIEVTPEIVRNEKIFDAELVTRERFPHGT
jgi:ABC-type transport system involved in cytochrome c biogenesis permease subunit